MYEYVLFTSIYFFLVSWQEDCLGNNSTALCHVVWPQFCSQVWSPGVNEAFLYKGCYFRPTVDFFMQTLVPFREDVVLAPASFLHTQRSASPPSTRSPLPWFSPPCSPPQRLLLRHDSFLYLMTVNFLVLWASLLYGPLLKYIWSKRPFSW